MPPENDKHVIDLFLSQKDEINSLRDDVQDCKNKDTELGYKLDLTNQKIDMISQRINEGISKTVSETFKAVSGISQNFVLIDQKVKDHDFWIKWMFRGVFIVIFLYAIFDISLRLKP